MIEGGQSRPADFGRRPENWRRILGEALDGRDHEGVRQALVLLRAEIRAQDEELECREREAGLDRLVEQARRLLGAEPTAAERLEQELSRERALWATFRERYRDVFVPADLQPFLDSCAAFLAPARGGVQYDGCDKYVGRIDGRSPQIVTLFRPAGEEHVDETPANFFARHEPASGRLTVERCYRTFLPRGAGEAVIHEQLTALVAAPADLRELVFDNVQNRATYDAHVDRVETGTVVRPGVSWDASPLGRLAGRVLARSGRVVDGAVPRLDGFGFLDLVLSVRPGG
jgi:hypothetical protein